MKIEEFKDHFSANNSQGLQNAVNLFVYSMPERVQEGAVFLHEPSLIEAVHETPGIFKGRIQVITRSKDYSRGYDMARDAFKVMKMNGTQLASIFVDYCRPLGTPTSYRRSAGDLIEFSVNFDVRYHDPDFA